MTTKRSLLISAVVLTCLLACGPSAIFPKAESPKTKPKITAEHYRIFDTEGKPATLQDVIEKMTTVQVTFLGETHDDPVAHHLQMRILESFHQQCKKGKNKVALSLEMFERDAQPVVDEYLADLITEKHFLASSRPWKNYKKDYRPLVEYAKKHKLAVIAANAPRRYVNRVSRLGASSLRKIPNPHERGLPPLPYAKASQKYAAHFKAVMEKMRREHAKKTKKNEKAKTSGKSSKKSKKPPPFDMKKGLEAQSLWDATMAYSIAEHLGKFPEARIVHLNGSFHTERRLGIADHLRRYRPGTKFLVVTILSHKAFPRFDCKEMHDRGDFVVVTDPTLRKKKKK